MRVVHVLHSFGTGGMENGIATLARHASPGLEHVVLCAADGGESERLLPRATEVVTLGKTPGHSSRFLLRLGRELKRLRPDVVHTRNWVGMDGVIASRLAGIRAVVHGEHGWGMDDPFGRDTRRIRVRRWLSRWIRECTCVSAQMSDWLRTTVGVRCPVTQIYNGVDTDRFRPPESKSWTRRGLGLPENGFLVGIVGRLDPIKNHPVLFDALRRIRGRHGDARLLVVGEGPERRSLESLAGEGVEFLGNRSDVDRIYGALDLFVLCSRNEGISNTILEAMASGLPVVATDVGGNPELVTPGVTGRLVPSGDVEALSDAIEEYLLDEAERSRHGMSARERCLRDFSVQAMVRAYEAVWSRTGA